MPPHGSTSTHPPTVPCAPLPLFRAIRIEAIFFVKFQKLQTHQKIKFQRNTRKKMKIFSPKFCRVCGFRVRVWGSYGTSRSFGYGYGSVTGLPEVPGVVAQAYRTHRSSGRVQNMLYPYPGYCGTGLTELTEVPGTGMKILQNLQKFRVRV